MTDQSNHRMEPAMLESLLEQHCNGRLSEADSQRLAAALRADADARRHYLRYMDLHSALAWRASTQLEQDLAEPVQAAPASQRPGQTRLQRWTRVLRTRQGISATVATVTLLLVMGVLAFTPVRQFVWRGASGGVSIAAAELTGDLDCRWKTAPIRLGETLYQGQSLELLEGTAEITFLGGAVTTIRGPASVAIDSPMQGSLRAGKLTARVPKRAVGFIVRTPAARVVDLGTEFGVKVAADGDEEVHVFKGLVDVTIQASNTLPVRLRQSEALRIPAGRKVQPQRLASARQEQFPRQIEASGTTTLAESLAPEAHPPVTRGLAVWLAADGAVRCAAGDYVTAWLDMPAGDNQKLQHATQPIRDRQPRWIADGVSGKPALRFEGDDLLLLPTPTDIGVFNRPYEIFVVARTSSSEIQFLIAGGMEEFELHLNGDAGARFIPTGFERASDGSDLGANAAFSNGQPHLFSASVDETTRRGAVGVDGQVSAASTAHDARSVSNVSLQLGMRFNGTLGLTGDIAEVLIYRQALSTAERREVSEYLAKKYAIRLGD